MLHALVREHTPLDGVFSASSMIPAKKFFEEFINGIPVVGGENSIQRP